MAVATGGSDGGAAENWQTKWQRGRTGQRTTRRSARSTATAPAFPASSASANAVLRSHCDEVRGGGPSQPPRPSRQWEARKSPPPTHIYRVGVDAGLVSEEEGDYVGIAVVCSPVESVPPALQNRDESGKE